MLSIKDDQDSHGTCCHGADSLRGKSDKNKITDIIITTEGKGEWCLENTQEHKLNCTGG